MYNGLIIDELLESRKIQKKIILDYLEIPRDGGGTALKQIMTGNPTVKRLEPVADFFQVSMDIFFNRKVPFTPLGSNVVGNGNAVGNGNTVMTPGENECKMKLEALERLLEEKEKRIETLETLVQVLRTPK